MALDVRRGVAANLRLHAVPFEEERTYERVRELLPARVAAIVLIRRRIVQVQPQVPPAVESHGVG
eukprot:29080-Pelagococcus_subviridis.AAC.4